jgi:N-acetylmuramoyl-L-alanine amidase
MKRRINSIVIHCTATPPHMDIGVPTVRKWHVEERGWSDIGYHFLVTRDGTVCVGRPLSRAGAHAKGHNADSIGVCYVGGVDENMKPQDNRTEAQASAMYDLICELTTRFHVTDVLGHCDLPRVTKACPSFNVRQWFYGED